MNWRRGLFRLWLAATVAWLLVVGGLLLTDDLSRVWKLRHYDSSFSCLDPEISKEPTAIPAPIFKEIPPDDPRLQGLQSDIPPGFKEVSPDDPQPKAKRVELGPDPTFTPPPVRDEQPLTGEECSGTDRIKAELAKRKALAEKRLMRNTPRMLAPPAAVFILGIIGFWIAAGFRKR